MYQLSFLVGILTVCMLTVQLVNPTTSEECDACGSWRAQNPRGIEQAVDGRNQRQAALHEQSLLLQLRVC